MDHIVDRMSTVDEKSLELANLKRRLSSIVVDGVELEERSFHSSKNNADSTSMTSLLNPGGAVRHQSAECPGCHTHHQGLPQLPHHCGLATSPLPSERSQPTGTYSAPWHQSLAAAAVTTHQAPAGVPYITPPTGGVSHVYMFAAADQSPQPTHLMMHDRYDVTPSSGYGYGSSGGSFYAGGMTSSSGPIDMISAAVAPIPTVHCSCGDPTCSRFTLHDGSTPRIHHHHQVAVPSSFYGGQGTVYGVGSHQHQQVHQYYYPHHFQQQFVQPQQQQQVTVGHHHHQHISSAAVGWPMTGYAIPAAANQLSGAVNTSAVEYQLQGGSARHSANGFPEPERPIGTDTEQTVTAEGIQRRRSELRPEVDERFSLGDRRVEVDVGTTTEANRRVTPSDFDEEIRRLTKEVDAASMASNGKTVDDKNAEVPLTAATSSPSANDVTASTSALTSLTPTSLAKTQAMPQSAETNVTSSTTSNDVRSSIHGNAETVVVDTAATNSGNSRDEVVVQSSMSFIVDLSGGSDGAGMLNGSGGLEWELERAAAKREWLQRRSKLRSRSNERGDHGGSVDNIATQDSVTSRRGKVGSPIQRRRTIIGQPFSATTSSPSTTAGSNPPVTTSRRLTSFTSPQTIKRSANLKHVTSSSIARMHSSDEDDDDITNHRANFDRKKSTWTSSSTLTASPNRTLVDKPPIGSGSSTAASANTGIRHQLQQQQQQQQQVPVRGDRLSTAIDDADVETAVRNSLHLQRFHQLTSMSTTSLNVISKENRKNDPKLNEALLLLSNDNLTASFRQRWKRQSYAGGSAVDLQKPMLYSHEALPSPMDRKKRVSDAMESADREESSSDDDDSDKKSTVSNGTFVVTNPEDDDDRARVEAELEVETETESVELTSSEFELKVTETDDELQTNDKSDYVIELVDDVKERLSSRVRRANNDTSMDSLTAELRRIEAELGERRPEIIITPAQVSDITSAQVSDSLVGRQVARRSEKTKSGEKISKLLFDVKPTSRDNSDQSPVGENSFESRNESRILHDSVSTYRKPLDSDRHQPDINGVALFVEQSETTVSGERAEVSLLSADGVNSFEINERSEMASFAIKKKTSHEEHPSQLASQPTAQLSKRLSHKASEIDEIKAKVVDEEDTEDVILFIHESDDELGTLTGRRSTSVRVVSSPAGNGKRQLPTVPPLSKDDRPSLNLGTDENSADTDRGCFVEIDFVAPLFPTRRTNDTATPSIKSKMQQLINAKLASASPLVVDNHLHIDELVPDSGASAAVTPGAKAWSPIVIQQSSHRHQKQIDHPQAEDLFVPISLKPSDRSRRGVRPQSTQATTSSRSDENIASRKSNATTRAASPTKTTSGSRPDRTMPRAQPPLVSPTKDQRSLNGTRQSSGRASTSGSVTGVPDRVPTGRSTSPVKALTTTATMLDKNRIAATDRRTTGTKPKRDSSRDTTMISSSSSGTSQRNDSRNSIGLTRKDSRNRSTSRPRGDDPTTPARQNRQAGTSTVVTSSQATSVTPGRPSLNSRTTATGASGGQLVFADRGRASSRRNATDMPSEFRDVGGQKRVDGNFRRSTSVNVLSTTRRGASQSPVRTPADQEKLKLAREQFKKRMNYDPSRSAAIARAQSLRRRAEAGSRSSTGGGASSEDDLTSSVDWLPAAHSNRSSIGAPDEDPASPPVLLRRRGSGSGSGASSGTHSSRSSGGAFGEAVAWLSASVAGDINALSRSSLTGNQLRSIEDDLANAPYDRIMLRSILQLAQSVNRSADRLRHHFLALNSDGEESFSSSAQSHVSTSRDTSDTTVKLEEILHNLSSADRKLEWCVKPLSNPFRHTTKRRENE